MLKKFKIHSEYEVDQLIYLNKALNMVAEHSKDSIVFVPCFPVIERPFLPLIKRINALFVLTFVVLMVIFLLLICIKNY